MAGRGEGVAAALEPLLHVEGLRGILGQRATKVPFILRRNLSYMERAPRQALAQGSGQVLDLQLVAAASGLPPAPASCAVPAPPPADVVIAAVCVVTVGRGGTQAFVPVAARGTVVPPQPGSDRTQLGLQLPLAGGTPAGLQGRCLLLLCRRSTQLASLLSLASWERSCSGWRQACGGSGCKPLTPGVAAGAAFGVLSSGARLSYLVIPLDGLGASGSGRAPGGVQQHKQRLRWKDGVLTTHVPAAPASGGAAPAAPFPWIELQQLGQQQAEEQQLGQEDSSKAAPLDCRLRLVEAGSGGERQAGSKRKAGALEEREAGEQAGATPPPPGPQQQQQQRQQQPLVDIYCCSFDDSRFVREAQRGYACPHRSCGGLRCHSAAGLQQHLHASHAYHNYQFWDAGDGTGLLEVYLRCKPAWIDSKGRFLPRDLAVALQPNSQQPGGGPGRSTLFYHCPPRARRLRLGDGGLYPRLEGEEEEVEADGGWLEEEEEETEPLTAPPSSSAPDSSAPGGSLAAAARPSRGKAAPAAAKALPRARKAAAPVRRRGQGLQLLNHQGRPKFYHSRTCVAMTRAELLADGDSDVEGELAEWKRDCSERLAEQRQLCGEQREFMASWNLWVHRHHVHADADLPAAVAAFAAAHAAQLAADGPFRRCLDAYLLNLWRFRLLTPAQLHTLTAGLPQLHGAVGRGTPPAATAVDA
ncbi:polycomb group EMBRYONIC FLOWER 2 isoform X1 [Micractinium conductrix]|uniref:Polycomb group EMBRYONIC FLOWER 2 isoform X1 n=1 Tax=Micractinium conductrix TaxID=554055 RepID=A0A2P6V8G1_9CHLO|nr:polycomb group EMBRYONIC FLOWER 2 isoform X1 [Micractinium conductrix]|eukprot:PSC70361.1 polycomb group EMBRYONIC FLOWER 2 isoform X1 [Micractinium conductrix]